jgi:hypothetical protein
VIESPVRFEKAKYMNGRKKKGMEKTQAKWITATGHRVGDHAIVIYLRPRTWRIPSSPAEWRRIPSSPAEWITKEERMCSTGMLPARLHPFSFSRTLKRFIEGQAEAEVKGHKGWNKEG